MVVYTLTKLNTKFSHEYYFLHVFFVDSHNGNTLHYNLILYKCTLVLYNTNFNAARPDLALATEGFLNSMRPIIRLAIRLISTIIVDKVNHIDISQKS